MARPSKPHKTSLGYWRCRIGGKQYHLGKSKPHAIAEFHRLMAIAGKDRDPSRPEFIADAIRRWLARNPGEDRTKRLKSFILFAGKITIDDVNRDVLVDFAKHLKKSNLASSTVIARLCVATQVMRWAHDNEWIDRVPDKPKLAPPIRRARDIPAEKLSEVLASLRVPTGRLVRFIAYTGCRPIEARMLQWSDVDLNRGVCLLNSHKTAHKTARPRTLYLTPQATEVLETTPRNHDFVFISQLGRPYTMNGLKSILSSRGITPYQLRHAFAQIASEQIPEEELAKLMGHQSTQTTRYYYQIRSSRAKAAASKLVLPAPAAPPAPPLRQTGAVAASPKRKRTRRPAQANRRVS